jgi:hypothetical protein
MKLFNLVQGRYLMIADICLLIIFVGCFYFVISKTPIFKKGVVEEENQPPKVEARGTGTGCGISVAEMFFYSSDPDSEDKMTAYQIQIDDNSDFSHCPDSPPTKNLMGGKSCLFDTGKETKIKETLKSYDSTFKYSLPKGFPQKVYFWRVRVWDNKDTPSDWAKATLDLSG